MSELVAEPMAQHAEWTRLFRCGGRLPVTTDTGVKVTIHLAPFVKAVLLRDEELLSLQPGQRNGGTAYWQDAGLSTTNRKQPLAPKGFMRCCTQRCAHGGVR